MSGYSVEDINSKINDLLFQYAKYMSNDFMTFEEYALVKCVLLELQVEFNGGSDE